MASHCLHSFCTVPRYADLNAVIIRPNEESTMKKFLLACALIGAVSAVHAQSTQPAPADRPMPPPMAMHGHEFDPAKRAEYLQKSLQLSDEQTAKVKKLFESDIKKHQAIEDKYKPQFEAFRKDMDKLRDDSHKELDGILTAKQKEAMATQHPRMSGGERGRGEQCPRDGKHGDHGRDQDRGGDKPAQ